MNRFVLGAAIGVAAIAILFWVLTIPATVTAADLPPYMPNVDNGRTMFHVGGCASCHATPNNDAKKRDETRLGGGLALPSPFGTFFVPNISPDPADGIGAWSEADFVTALWKGTSRRGRHLFPAFPYSSYQQMQLTDVRDLFAFLKTLPPVSGRPRRHDLVFPFNVRRLVGVWKLLFFHGGPFVPDATKSAQLNRGAYLVNAPGHCAECHSPRNFLGAVVDGQRFAGGPAPDGKGWVPNITPTGLQHQDPAWSEKDIASFLGDGMTPSGDFAGGAMADVVRNLEQIDKADRDAMATYIYALPAREGPPRLAKRPQKP
jgi:mono/diheme cytochrome c family protein